MYDELMARVRRTQAEFEFELARTTDPYRLQHLLDQQALKSAMFANESGELIRALEDD